MPATLAKPKAKLIRESTVISRPTKVDREAGVMEDVKIVGLQSPKKSRRYEAQALKEAQGLYEGVKVNLNHQPKGSIEPRRFEDRIGFLEGIYFKEGDGLYAKRFKFNPKHPAAESLSWWAEHEPSGVGFSHLVKGNARLIGGTEIVESINTVQSVDLVADPATTRGLFESDEVMEGDDVDLKTLTVEQLKTDRGDLVKAILSEANESSEIESLKEQNKKLAEAVAGFEADRKRAERSTKAKKACTDAKLPATAITDLFVESLVGAGDEKWQALIDDRKSLAGNAPPQNNGGGQKPQSVEQRFGEANTIDESFGPQKEMAGKELASFYGV